jgi:LysM repeat protein
MFRKELKKIAGNTLPRYKSFSMRNKLITVFCLSLILFSAFAEIASAQVVVERSKDKIIISGIQYYIHQVKKGETAYSISKAYGITVEELNRENPPAVYGINEGQALRIPVKEVTDNKLNEAPKPILKKDETKFIYHKIEPGETVYAISKKYGVSDTDIVASNQGIEISRLPVGAEIAVPRKEFMTERQEFVARESNYLFHKVVKGESLSSIAAQYGLTVKDLRKENRNVRFPQVGDYIRIPVEKAPEIQAAAVSPKDSAAKDVLKPAVEYSRPSGHTPVKNLKGSYDVAVLLPFYIGENAVRNDLDSTMIKGKKVFKLINRSEDWIYPRSLGFIEMYQGILLAADTLRSLGMDVSIHCYDIRGDTIELTRLINSGDLDKMNLIIGPVNTSNLAKVAAYAGKLGVPVISPVPLFNNSVLAGNPNLFMANASLEVSQIAIARKVGEFYDKNFVFIHDDSAGVDPDVRGFRQKIVNELSNRQPFEELKFKEFLFATRSAFNNDSINRLSHALSATTDNIVIIASDEAPVISETLQDLQGLSKKYPIKVFGYPSMRGIDNLDPRYLFDMDLLIFSPYWIDYDSRKVKQFNADFREKFVVEPGEMSYAWLGYDLTYYFLSGLAIHGKDFLSHPEIHNPELLETEFDFRSKNPGDGFENQKLYPVRYTREYDVKIDTESAPK